MSVRPNDFTARTRELLSQAVGFHCVRPGCQAVTSVLSADGTKMVSIGIAAHDAPASQFGPRWEDRDAAGYTREQIRAYTNGAWLCASCARLVDVEPDLYPLSTLPVWQQQAVQARRNAQSRLPSDIDYRSSAKAAHDFCKLLPRSGVYIEQRQGPSGYENVATTIMNETRNAMQIVTRQCSFLTPYDPLNTLYPHTRNLQDRVVNAYRTIERELSKLEYWYEDPHFARRLCNTYGVLPTEQELQRQTMTLASGRRVKEMWLDACIAADALQQFSVCRYSAAFSLYGW